MPYLAKLSARLNAAIALAALLATGASAQQAGHTVTIVVPDHGWTQARVALDVEAPEDDGRRYAVEAHRGAARKITGGVDGAAGVTVRFEAPPGGRSHGTVDLGGGPRDLVGDVTVSSSGLEIAYEPAPSGPREPSATVTYTLTRQ